MSGGQWTLSDVITAVRDTYVSSSGREKPDQVYNGIITDSRRARPQTVFVALRGSRFNGHDFAAAAAAAGARLLILDHALPIEEDVIQVIVSDTGEAYGQLAHFHRLQFQIPVICVVGANGKTTTAQMTAAILREQYGSSRVHVTEKNFNNEVGVPQTLLALNPGHMAAVVEAGMNHPGEMERLARWIAPTIVLVTNAQREHQEFIDGVEGSARENGKAILALRSSGIAVLPAADYCLPIWRELVKKAGAQSLTYGADLGGDISCDFAARTDGEMFVVEQEHCSPIKARLQLSGSHAAHDAAAACAAAMLAGADTSAASRGLASFLPLAGRGARYRLPGGQLLIDDSYNANPDSMRAAIDTLAALPGRRVLVAGDMGETGGKSGEFHEEIGAYARRRGIDEMVVIGREMQAAARVFGEGALVAGSVDELVGAVLSRMSGECTILFKASHFMGFEGVVARILGAAAGTEGQN